jgi:TRAP-type C4-dicarboxylate transport system permease small subunit
MDEVMRMKVVSLSPEGAPSSCALSRALDAAEKCLSSVESAMATIAMLGILFAMGSVCVDAIGRYVFHAPLRWVTEFTTIYLLPTIFFLGLASSLAKRAHIAVDILMARLGTSKKLVCGIVAQLLSCIVFLLIFVILALRLEAIVASKEVMPGVFIWPLWPSAAVACLGTLVASLRSAFELVTHLSAFAGWIPIDAVQLDRNESEAYE